MDIIHKGVGDLKLTPNFTDYETTRESFTWSQVPDLCAGMGGAGCNIAYAAVDRHAEGPHADRTALRFIADDPDAAELVTHDISYAELGRLTRRFTNVLRGLGIGKGDRVFVIMGRVPELYISMLGALRNGSVVSPLFSAFGPEPIATRVTIGSANRRHDRCAGTHRQVPPGHAGPLGGRRIRDAAQPRHRIGRRPAGAARCVGDEFPGAGRSTPS